MSQHSQQTQIVINVAFLITDMKLGTNILAIFAKNETLFCKSGNIGVREVVREISQ